MVGCLSPVALSFQTGAQRQGMTSLERQDQFIMKLDFSVRVSEGNFKLIAQSLSWSDSSLPSFNSVFSPHSALPPAHSQTPKPCDTQLTHKLHGNSQSKAPCLNHSSWGPGILPRDVEGVKKGQTHRQTNKKTRVQGCTF